MFNICSNKILKDKKTKSRLQLEITFYSQHSKSKGNELLELLGWNEMPVISEYMHMDFPLLQIVNLYLSFEIKKIKMETKAHFPDRKFKIIKSSHVRPVIYLKRLLGY